MPELLTDKKTESVKAMIADFLKKHGIKNVSIKAYLFLHFAYLFFTYKLVNDVLCFALV